MVSTTTTTTSAAAAASATKTSSSSLPCKKRKASNASSSTSSSTIIAAPGEVAGGGGGGGGGGASCAVSVSASASVLRTSSSSIPIRESRLPSKKRKESHEEQQQQQQQQHSLQRKGSASSCDLPTFLGDDHHLAARMRRGSVDDASSSLLLPNLPLRKASHDGSSLLPHLDDVLSLSLGGGGCCHSSSHHLSPPPPPPLQEPEPSSPQLPDAADTSSVAAAPGRRQQEATSALDHLDALHSTETKKPAANPAAAATATVKQHAAAKSGGGGGAAVAGGAAAAGGNAAVAGGGGGDDSSHDETFASSGHRLLMEAIMMSNTSETKSGGSKQPHQLDHLPLPFPYRDRLDSFTGGGGGGGITPRDRLDSFAAPTRERLDSFCGRRDRLESWGGMSDLSVPLGSSDSVVATAMAAASNLHHGYLMEDPDDPVVHSATAAAAAASAIGHSQHPNHEIDNDQKPSAIPSKISLQRDRLNSIASLGDSSLINFPLMVDGIDMTGDIQAFVAAAMASVGDQLEELAGAMEEVTGEAMNFEDFKREMGLERDGGDSSVASPMIGAVSDAAAAASRRPRAWSTSSGRISVDMEAVQAAVDAAEAASGSLGLQTMAPPPQKQPAAVTSTLQSVSQSTGGRSRVARRLLPLKRARAESSTSSTPTLFEGRTGGGSSGIDCIRERARAAAGYVPPKKSQPKKNLPPLKKRVKRASPDTPATVTSAAGMPTPRVSNRTLASSSETPIAPMVVSSSPDAKRSKEGSSKQGGQANQKWEGMYSCLLRFAEERRVEETRHMTDDEKMVWMWDGNVPTTYKTKDGMALGRWVNNQRSARSKGNLKDDREQRLVDAGLKWSVLVSNSWNEMLEELSIYIKNQHRQGKAWDGNVPTNYQIKSRHSGSFNGEDKNLGRWVNRQRSMYQAGRLRKDRQLALEGVGLKWSMLATISWEEMYETLKVYVDQQKKDGTDGWDGNVPANYRTNDNPPRALGRWINRQRSAYAKNKLKKECVDKLNLIGLKWSVNHRHGEHDDMDDGESGDLLDNEPSDGKEDGGGGGGDSSGNGKGGGGGHGNGDSSGKENAEKTIEAESEPLIQAV